MKINDNLLIYGALAGLGLVLATYVGTHAKQAGQAVGSAAVDLANGVITGSVISIGEAVNVPPTSQTACEKAKADGNTWDASFACPAGDFLSYWWNK